MDTNKPAPLRVWAPLLFAIVMILGMWLGYQLHDTLRNKRDFKSVVDRSDRVEQIMDLIKNKYVDSVNTNQLYQDAVKGVLTHLDPHTVYIPAEEVSNVNEELDGSFFGIGVEYAIVRDTIDFTSIVDKGPADKAGVIPGDKLIKVDDSVVAGTHITAERITKLLRGKQHTNVRVLVKDAAKGSERTVLIERDEVPISSVEAAFMLEPQTGYIRIDRFALTTAKDFTQALTKLKGQGMQQLILDLRDNPGGYIDAATGVADELLTDDKLIVSTKGLHSAPEEYKTEKPGLFEKGALIVLIDEGSASASEILSGALQDWDRAVIVGRRTFGKGLVQEQYDLDDGAALRLTIARYYTPSGRCIQRSFAGGKEAYAEDYSKRFSSGELTGNDSLVKDDTTKYYTANHRLVHGGGGIKPDVYVPYDTGRLSSSLLAILYGDDLQSAVIDYFNSHSALLRQYRNVSQFAAGFKDTVAIFSNYLASLPTVQRLTALRVLARPANKQAVLSEITAQLAKDLFRTNGYYSIASRSDDVIMRALSLLHSGEYSKIIQGQGR